MGTRVLRGIFRDLCISFLHLNPYLHPATSTISSTLSKPSSKFKYLLYSFYADISIPRPATPIYLIILLKKALILSIRVLGFGCRPLDISAWTACLLLAFSFSFAERYGWDLWSSHGARQMSHRKLEGPRRTGHFSPQTRHSFGT
jgi:hypothetical protein